MAKYQLKARVREGAGKGAARQLRLQGRVPAVIYGEARESQMLSIEARELGALFRTAGAGSHLVDLEIEGDRGKRYLALLKEIQEHPFKGDLLHVDLQHVSPKKKLTLPVPVVLTGEPVGVKTGGGVLELLVRELDIQCLPDDIPDDIRVDVSGLELGQSIHISDLQIEKVTVLASGTIPVATVARPTKVEEVAPAAEEVEAEAEGEEAPKEEAPADEEKSSEAKE